MDMALAPKAKRRQHVACDACKVRRIKCDLIDLLPPRLDGQGNERLPSFREQVRRNPKVQCTNCVKKDLKCTTEAIRNPAPPRKTGKTIDMLRERGRGVQGTQGEGEEDESEDADESESDEGPSGPQRPRTTERTLEDQALLPSEEVPVDLGLSLIGRDELVAYESWRSMIENLPTVTANAPALPLPTAAQHDEVGSAQRAWLDLDSMVSGPPISSVNWSAPASSLLPPSTMVSSSQPNAPLNSYPFTLDHAESSTSFSRKRRVGDNGQVIRSSEKPSGWHLWSRDEAVVVWGRKEIVQERLADRALGLELSKHLISIYFQVVHHAFPAVNPESFYIEWMRAGQRSDHMSPSQEALCAVLEAWGAQYSDHPVVLGLTRSQQAPALWNKDGTTKPLADQMQRGSQRGPVCRALAARAGKLIDYNGLHRRPSITGIQALLMYSMLVGVAGENSGNGGFSVEVNLSFATLVEQMTLLNLMWESPGDIPADPYELPLTTAQMRNKQRQVFWSAMVMDALHAADFAHLPRIPEADIKAAGKWVNVVQSTLPLSSFKLVAYFMQCYYRLAVVARRIAVELAVPNRRPGSVDVPAFCRSVREQWAEIRTLHREIAKQSTDIIEKCASTMGYGFPLSRLVSLRLGCSRMIFQQHQHIQTQLAFRRQLANRMSIGSREEDTTLLEELQIQSIDVLLQGSRTHIDMFDIVLPTGTLQTATLFVRAIVASALFLADMPTNEQGYPNDTLGGNGWTWDVKKQSMSVCIVALNQLGWSWSNMQNVLDTVNASMRRMTPSPDVLASYKPSSTLDERTLARLEEGRNEDRQSMQLALSYWPPESVPHLIDAVMAGLDINNASPAELVQRLTPENLHAKTMQRRHEQNQIRLLSRADSGDAMQVDLSDHAVSSSGPSGHSSYRSASNAPVSVTQQDSPGWGTCLYHFAENGGARMEGSARTSSVSRGVSKESSNMSVKHSKAQSAVPAGSASGQDRIGRDTNPLVPPKNGVAEYTRKINSTHAPTTSGGNTDLWGIDFALESGLFSQSLGPTPSSGSISRVASDTPSMPPPNLLYNAVPANVGAPLAFNGEIDQALSEDQIAELEEFLLQLDKLADGQDGTSRLA